MSTSRTDQLGAVLVRRVSWRGGEPELVVIDPAGGPDRRIALRGRRLGFRAVDPPGRRYCLGRDEIIDGARQHVPCPQSATVDVGRQCQRCRQRDAYRFMHISHRVDFVSPELEASLRRPHWLYIASFSEKLHKVGTVIDGRRDERLTEQGALVADIVAHCADGWAIRRLEDEVAATAGLPQSIRPAAKVAALSAPLDRAAVLAGHRRIAQVAREIVDGVEGEDDVTVVDQQWQSPVIGAVDTGARRLQYPLDVSVGEHGFVVGDCIGTTALVTVEEDPETTFVVDLSAVVGRRILTGPYRTRLPAMQDALF